MKSLILVILFTLAISMLLASLKEVPKTALGTDLSRQTGPVKTGNLSPQTVTDSLPIASNKRSY